jgi:hypothetical protein
MGVGRPIWMGVLMMAICFFLSLIEDNVMGMYMIEYFRMNLVVGLPLHNGCGKTALPIQVSC